MTSKISTKLLVCSVVLALAACSSDGKDKQPPAKTDTRPVEEMYNDAADALDGKLYAEAATKFEDLERQHPYSKWANLSQLMAGYAYYEAARYDEAIITLERFMELHPGHARVDYAMYLIGLCYYEQISDVTRDQDMTAKALTTFDSLIKRFPESQYTRDATLKRDLTNDHLAGKEMEIGRYYITRNEFNAAINRFRTVIRSYQTTTHVPEALHRLVESYLSLGLRDEATRVAAVLGHNFPGSRWYQDTYALMDPTQRQRLEDERGFVDRTLEGLLKPQ